MDKVKQIFKNDSPSSSRGSSGTSSDFSSANDGSISSANTSQSVENSQTVGKPTPHAHQHNVEHRHALPGEGEGSQTHDHKHMAAVTKEKHLTHETEEVQQVRDVDRHVHHVQHHVQPVLDTKHHDTQHSTMEHPVTHIKEQHVNTSADNDHFASLGAKHVDSQHEGPTERTIVDKGEVVNENVAHHVHHVVQPVIERDTHHHKTIHTTIPVKHTTHEAPIIHQSSMHEPMGIKDFVSQGGDLKSKLGYGNAGVLAGGDCERTVDGPAEGLASKLGLGGHTTDSGVAQ